MSSWDFFFNLLRCHMHTEYSICILTYIHAGMNTSRYTWNSSGSRESPSGPSKSGPRPTHPEVAMILISIDVDSFAGSWTSCKRTHTFMICVWLLCSYYMLLGEAVVYSFYRWVYFVTWPREIYVSILLIWEPLVWQKKSCLWSQTD